MTILDNTTPFGAIQIPSADRDGRDLLLIIIAARFVIPEPPQKQLQLQSLDLQRPPPLADEYQGEPSSSSLKLEGQATYTRQATDIYINGEACAPQGNPVDRLDVRVEIGPCKLRFQVVGDRVWLASEGAGAVASRPERFFRMPIVWERAFGGVAGGSTPEKPLFEARNPVGCGFEKDAKTSIGRPLPNIEAADHPLKWPGDRPPPIGLGPIARSWQPRLSYAGTYDERWRRERAPLWPPDFDERFFNAAPTSLQAHPHLSGGEQVCLDGLSSKGRIEFRLPRLRFSARSRFVDREVMVPLRLDGIVIDTIAHELSMYFRGTVSSSLGIIKHRETLLRLIQPWEPEVRVT